MSEQPNYCVIEASSCIEIIHSKFGIQGWLDLLGLVNYVAHAMITLYF